MHKHRTLQKANAFRNKVLVNYHKCNFLIFSALTILLVLKSQTTVFYLIYFFWWNELLRLLIDKLFFQKKTCIMLPNPPNTGVFQSFIQMGVYFVFIVVFFVVRKFPDTFTPTNLWGSVLIVVPFLLIKLLLTCLNQPIKYS